MDMKRRQYESVFEAEERHFKEENIDLKIKWCKEHGKDCQNCESAWCELNSEYGNYDKPKVN